MTGSIMSAVPLGKAGVGSAMNDTTRELGGALGVAVLGSLVASRYDARLSPALDLLPASLAVRRARASPAHCMPVPTSAGATGAQVSTVAREAFVSGMHLAAVIAGCVALLAAGIVYRKLPSGNPHAIGAASLTRESSRPSTDARVEIDSAGTEMGAYGPSRCPRRAFSTDHCSCCDIPSGNEEQGGRGRDPGVEDGGEQCPAEAELDGAATNQ